MLKEEAIEILAQGRSGALSVATMQGAAPWHEAGQGKSMHIDASGCMGSAASLALGLALGRPQDKVIVIDGDGSLLMQLGSLVTVASTQAENYYHFVFANGLYESSGNQPIPGQGIFDFCALAKGAGYRCTFNFETAAEFKAGLPEVLASKGPVFINLKIARDDRKPRWAGISMSSQVKALRAELETR
ncbi:MAG TPA: thiamine pyrophosphate-dependent enzyme [Alphaproteobacteria bacterium]|jgi:phosphonopyruvate decarboxylase